MALNKEYEDIGYDIIGASYEVRNTAGKNMREVYYKSALAWELRQRGYVVEVEKTIPALYKGIQIDDSYRADIVVDNRVIIEVKAKGHLGEEEARQLITYLSLSGYKLGYLINFGAASFKSGRLSDALPYNSGIYRIVNKLE